MALRRTQLGQLGSLLLPITNLHRRGDAPWCQRCQRYASRWEIVERGPLHACVLTTCRNHRNDRGGAAEHLHRVNFLDGAWTWRDLSEALRSVRWFGEDGRADGLHDSAL